MCYMIHECTIIKRQTETLHIVFHNDPVYQDYEIDYKIDFKQ